jgi:FkbM family methyltransferase
MDMKIAALIRRKITERIVQFDVLRRPSIKYCIENELLPSLLARTPSDVVREMFNLPPSEHKTQLNQDVFALLMNKFRAGFFLEIGANDGFTLSNTIYLEENFGWKGILVEANKKYMTSLGERKNSVVVNKAVSSKKGREEFIDAGLYGGLKASLDSMHYRHTKDAECITVDCMSLQEVLDMADAPQQIDFISIDVEGGEVPIVEQMVSVKQRFGCGCIEYNDRMDDYKRIVALLESSGYKTVWENQTQQDLFFIDEHARWIK